MKGVRKPFLAAIALAVISAILVFSAIGETLPYAFFRPVALNGPDVADSDGTTTAIADSQSRRILVLDENMELVNIIGYDAFNAPIQAVTDINIAHGTIFVAGVVYENDSSLIAQEKVLAYRRDGTYLGPVYASVKKSAATTAIKSLNEAPGGTVAVICEHAGAGSSNASRTSVSFIGLCTGGPAAEVGRTGIEAVFDVFDVAYSSANRTYTALSSRGLLFDGMADGREEALNRLIEQDLTFTSVDIGDDGNIYACEDTTGNIYRVDSETGEAAALAFIAGNGHDSVNVNGTLLTTCNLLGNEVVIADLDGGMLGDITAAPLSAPLLARVVLTEAAGIYLLAFVVVMAARRLRRPRAAGRPSRLGPVFSSLAVVVAVGLAIGFATHDAYRTSLDTRSAEINACATYIAATSDDLSAPLGQCKKRSAFKQQGERLQELSAVQSEIYRRLGTLATSATGNGIGIYLNVYGMDEQGAFYIYDSSSEHILGAGGTDIETRPDIMKAFDPEDDGSETGRLQTGGTLRDTTLYRLVPVPGVGGTGTVGVVEVGCRMKSFEAAAWSGLTHNALALVVIALVVYLTYSEARGCLRCMFRYRQLQTTRTKDAVAVLTRPFTFAVTLLTSIDAVMTVLIAKDLVFSAGLDDQPFLMALPAAMLGAGMALGHGMYGRLGARVDMRRLAICGAGAMGACALLTVAVVAMESFWLYCLAKLLMAVPFGLLYTLGYSLPRRAESAEVKDLAKAGISRTDLSAAALGTLLGGLIAQLLGSQWVYVLVAFAALLVLLIAAGLFPKRYGPIEAVSERHRGAASLFRRPSTLALALLVMAPAIIAAGYNTFIFPLLTTDAGATVASTNLLFVIGQIVTYASLGLIDRTAARFGSRRVATAAVGLLGVVFLLFSLNTAVVWAVIVIALVGMLYKAAECWGDIWIGAAAEAGVPAGAATGSMLATMSVFRVAQPIVLGFLVGLGNSIAVIVIGAACVACALAYRAISRRAGAETRIESGEAHGGKNG